MKIKLSKPLLTNETRALKLEIKMAKIRVKQLKHLVRAGSRGLDRNKAMLLGAESVLAKLLEKEG